MVNEFEIKKQLCDIGKRIYNRNMVAANDGNFSVKVAENEYLCTPTGVSKGFMTPEFICSISEETRRRICCTCSSDLRYIFRNRRYPAYTADHARGSYRSWMRSDR